MQKRATEKDIFIAKMIKKRRIEIGMSQKELGYRLGGVPNQQIYKHEIGIDRISASRFLDMVGALDIDIAKFYNAYKKKFND